MKRILSYAGSALLLLLVACGQDASLEVSPAFTQDPAAVFINEIHYDNDGTDAGEAIEIAGPAGTNLSGWSVLLYNGNGGAVYDTKALSGTILEQQGGYGTVQLTYPANGVQNGSPDGLALVDAAGQVVQFLSYEGVLTATGGAASGVASTDIGVAEAGTEPVGQSLQLKGAGNSYQSFTWAAVSAASLGAPNSGQTFSGGPLEPPEPPVGSCAVAPALTKISVVQGSGAATLCANQTVSLEGIVVGDYEGPSPTLRGFYLQEESADQDSDPATSEGIFVFNGSSDSVALGQTVNVTGTVSEFQGQTQVTAASVSVISAGPALLAPTPVSLPVASAEALEPLEGMYVNFPQALSVTEMFQLGRFGEVLLSSGGRLPQPTSVALPGAAAAVQAANDLNQIIVDDASQAQNPDPIVLGRAGQPLSASNTLRGGDTVTNLTGVMTYTWGGNSASPNAYRVRPVGDLSDLAPDSDAPNFSAANPRPSTAPSVGGDLKVSSFNVLNYFLTLDTSGTPCGPDGAKQECRGAESAEELARQQAKLTAALSALDADIFGLIELENTPGVEPLADIVSRLNAVKRAGTYSFVATGTIGTDAIKVGLIYKTAAVTPVGAPQIGSDPVFSRPPLAQTFEDGNGARFSVVVNHFKSKGSCPASGDPNADQGDGQGCWNVQRTQQAEALAAFVSTALTNPDVLLIGDLNAYAKEDPVRALEAAGFVNETERFGGEDAYSYVFDGQWGYLDHALASASLSAQLTGAADFHINADEPSVLDYNTNFKTPAQVAGLYVPDATRTSDHDPVVIGLELDAPVQDLDALLGALQAKVRDLYYARELTRTRTLLLLAPLKLAEFQLERGHEAQAERALRRFEDLTRLYERRRYLSATTASELRADAAAIRDLL